jgi:hypothetical protein
MSSSLPPARTSLSGVALQQGRSRRRPRVGRRRLRQEVVVAGLARQLVGAVAAEQESSSLPPSMSSFRPGRPQSRSRCRQKSDVVAAPAVHRVIAAERIDVSSPDVPIRVSSPSVGVPEVPRRCPRPVIVTVDDGWRLHRPSTCS